jgi:hypothetical protein
MAGRIVVAWAAADASLAFDATELVLAAPQVCTAPCSAACVVAYSCTHADSNTSCGVGLHILFVQ